MRNLFLALLLVGCSRSDRVVVRGPDGPAVLVTCGSYDACLEEASEGCPFGYDVVDKNSQSSVSGFASGGQGFVRTGHKESMLIKCRRRGAYAETP